MIRLFDPWGDSYCTCPRKYSLNPYTGCEHACVYCYITSYIPRAFEARLKKNLLSEVRRQRARLDPGLVISMANSSDPYTPMERRFKRTRACLRLLRRHRVLIITKSDLVTRDIDVLREMRCCVSMTVTTLDRDTAKRLEPGAPSPQKRLRALEKLMDAGIRVACRVDPIIPGINEDTAELIDELGKIGVPHVVSSTFKARPDSWRRLSQAFPEQGRELRALYLRRGERHGNAWYLPREMRMRLLGKVMEECASRGIEFATCREALGLRTPNARSCDGSHLIGSFKSTGMDKTTRRISLGR
jgi:DNA repair photolyase